MSTCSGSKRTRVREVRTWPEARQQHSNVVFHVPNRGNERREIFADDADYAVFMRVISQTMRQHPIAILAYCLMP
ncbi:MAG: hypothetical protein WC058_13225, partial [Phycisphaeraceae bacterium]